MLRRSQRNNYHVGNKAYMVTLRIEDMMPLLSTVEVCSAPLDAHSPALLDAHSPALLDAHSPAPLDAHSPALLDATGRLSTGRLSTACISTARLSDTPLATCRLTALGEEMRKAWLTLPQRFQNISITDSPDEYVIMPEHFHGIIYVTAYMEEHLSDIVRLFKARVSMSYRKLLTQAASSPVGMEPPIAPVGMAKDWLKAYQALPPSQQAATRQWIEDRLLDLYSATSRGTNDAPPPFRVVPSGSHNKKGFLFATGYTDGLLLDDENLDGHRFYISNNPRSRWLRTHNRDLLKANRQGIDTAVTLNALDGYLRRECPPRDVTDTKLATVRSLLLCSATSRGTIECHSYGDRALLKRRLLPVVCHRKDAACFQQQKTRCLHEAQGGAVMVSACISPKEREIMHHVMDADYPVIRIIDNGFPEIYHPSNTDIDLCAASMLLLLTPWQYHYRHKDEAVFVAYCKTMNCIAQALCRQRDDWWKT